MGKSMYSATHLMETKTLANKTDETLSDFASPIQESGTDSENDHFADDDAKNVGDLTGDNYDNDTVQQLVSFGYAEDRVKQAMKDGLSDINDITALLDEERAEENKLSGSNGLKPLDKNGLASLYSAKHLMELKTLPVAADEPESFSDVASPTENDASSDKKEIYAVAYDAQHLMELKLQTLSSKVDLVTMTPKDITITES